MVIANGENAAGGAGLTRETAEELFAAGIDVLTSGNHVWDQRQAWPDLEKLCRVLRPANYPPGVPGRGFCTVSLPHGGGELLIINLQGRVFMPPIDCPFRALDSILESRRGVTGTIVDFHAEATAEKAALGRYADGRVTAVVGTHTHVPTADAEVLPGGTAYVTDVGMVGPHHSVIGMKTEEVLERLLTQRPVRMTVGDGPVQFNSVLLTLDPASRRAGTIQRIDRSFR